MFQTWVSHILSIVLVGSLSFGTLSFICTQNTHARQVIWNSGLNSGRESIKSIGNWPCQLNPVSFGVWGLAFGTVYYLPIYLVIISQKQITLQRFFVFAGPAVALLIVNLPVIVTPFIADEGTYYDVSKFATTVMIFPSAMFTLLALLRYLQREEIQYLKSIFIFSFQCFCWLVVTLFGCFSQFS